MNGLHREDAETAVSWLCGEQRVSTKLGWKLLHGVVGKLVGAGFHDLSRVSPGSLRHFMTADFKKLPRLHVIEGGPGREKGIEAYSSLAMGRAFIAKRTAYDRERAFAWGVTDARPVANDNDPDLVKQPLWYTKVQTAWVRKAKERRNA